MSTENLAGHHDSLGDATLFLRILKELVVGGGPDRRRQQQRKNEEGAGRLV